MGPRNAITTCTLTDDVSTNAVPLAPPPGSRPAKREAFARDHPVRFVASRVAVAGAEIIIGILGVSALVAAFFSQLLPRIDLSWIPRPAVPDVDLPDWLRYINPLYWLSRLGLSWPDVNLPGWREALLDRKQYWLPIVIAVLIALGELDRRRKRDAQRTQDDERTQDDDRP